MDGAGKDIYIYGQGWKGYIYIYVLPLICRMTSEDIKTQQQTHIHVERETHTQREREIIVDHCNVNSGWSLLAELSVADLLLLGRRCYYAESPVKDFGPVCEMNVAIFCSSFLLP